MTVSQILFLSALIAALALAARYGGREERLAALALVLATVSTPLVLAHDYASPEMGVVIVDVGLFAALSAIALRSRAFWPIWAAGFQLCALAVHLAAAKSSIVLPAAYADTLAIWAYPVMAALCVGTLLEARARNG